MRTFSDWNNPLFGFMEADLVSHGGENVAGSFAHTLALTDIATGWTECVALAVREGWFNNRRLLEPIGYVPPAEYEAAYYRGQAKAA